MQETLASLGADYLFPKLHGRWARSLTGAALQRLLHGGRDEAIGRALLPLGIDVGRRNEVQKQLLQRHIAELDAIRRLLDRRSAAVYRAFLDRHYFENLKTILHYYVFPERGGDIRLLLIDAPGLPALDVDALLSARSPSQLFEHLPERPCREALLPVLLELAEKRDMLVAESRLDRLFYDALRSAAGHLPLGPRAAGRELVQTEIDVVNTVMILRNTALYRLPPAALVELCVPGGRHLGAALLERLCQHGTAAAVVADLPQPYRALLEPFTEAELYVSENALWNHLYRLAYRHFADYDRPAASLVAFAFLKRFETLNLGRLFEGMHFGLSAAEIEEMMIGAGHV